LEGNDEPKEPTLTLAQCASMMGMTDKELSQYESDLKTSRNTTITESMCDDIHEYIQSERKFAATRKSLNQLNQQIEDGYIQELFSSGSDDNIQCQTIVVKRREYYYLLEVKGSRRATTGLMDFDPEISDWQQIKIVEDPANPVYRVFDVRVIDKSSDKDFLVEKRKTICH